jgi:hypothetical protein
MFRASYTHSHILITLSEEFKLLSSSKCSFLHPSAPSFQRFVLKHTAFIPYASRVYLIQQGMNSFVSSSLTPFFLFFICHIPFSPSTFLPFHPFSRISFPSFCIFVKNSNATYYVISTSSSPMLEVLLKAAFWWQLLWNRTLCHLASLLRTFRSQWAQPNMSKQANTKLRFI